MPLDLEVGIGVSTNADDNRAGAEAAGDAIKELGKPADVIMVFAAPKFKHQKVLDGITKITKSTPMAGGTTAGEISPQGLTVNSVVVCALRSKDITFSVGIGKNISKSEVRAGAQLAKSVLSSVKKKKPSTLIMFPDGLAGDGLHVIKGAQKILGESFEIVGGALGDEGAFKNTYQFYNGTVYQNTVVGLLISGAQLTTATGVRSGWEAVGNRFTCTKSKGNVVYKFGDKTALEIYKDYLGSERYKKLPAIGLEYPLGLVDEKAEIEGYNYFQIRCPVGINEKDGSVTFAASIPEGKEVTLTYSSRTSIINGSKLAAHQAKKTLGSAKPRLVMMFSCVGRKMVLGRRTNEEINVVREVFGNRVPIVGFYTYGEIGPIDKRISSLQSTRWHNETVVVWVLAE